MAELQGRHTEGLLWRDDFLNDLSILALTYTVEGLGSNLDLCFYCLIFSVQLFIFIKPAPEFADPPADI